MKGFQRYRADTIYILKFTKGHNSVITVGGVMLIVLCTFSDDALYLYQFSRKYLNDFRVIERARFAY